LAIAEKIPIFQGLAALASVKGPVCGEDGNIRQDKLVCKEGENSNSIFILLSGELVAIGTGVELAHIKPVEILGEVGVIT
jgi:hypothetical protein